MSWLFTARITTSPAPSSASDGLLDGRDVERRRVVRRLDPETRPLDRAEVLAARDQHDLVAALMEARADHAADGARAVETNRTYRPGKSRSSKPPSLDTGNCGH